MNSNAHNGHPNIRRFKTVFQWIGRHSALIELSLLAAVIVLGLIGLRDMPNIWDRIYTTFQMVTLDYGDGYVNGWVNAARFLGTIFAVAIIYQIAGKAFIRFNHAFLGRFRLSDVFYGNDESVQKMMQSDDRFTVQINPDSDYFANASDYFLLDDEERNFNFYKAHEEVLKNKQVYLLSDTVPGTITASVGKGLLTTFSFEEKAARRYWLKYPLEEALPEKDMNHHMPDVKIAVAGLDSMGKELLYAAVQVNVFDPHAHTEKGQKIEYHVYAEKKEREDYRNHHIAENLKQLHIIIEDKTIMEESMDVLKQYDRIIIAQQKYQLELVNDLLGILTGTKVDIITAGNIPEAIYEHNRFGHKKGKDQSAVIDHQIHSIPAEKDEDDVRIYAWKDDVMNVAAVKDDELIHDAIEINAEYKDKENKNKEKLSEEEKLNLWNKELNSTFMRYSNIRSAFFRKYAFKWASGRRDLFQGMSEEEEIDYFARLEHISWWNYYLISNWTYSTVKSEYRRTHYDMVETDALPFNGEKNESENDREAAVKIIEMIKAGKKN